MNIVEIQRELRNQRLDGWLFFDHHRRDPLAYRVLGFSPPREPTRRWYYYIPASGEPRGLVNRIESSMLDALPGEKTTYTSWPEQVRSLTDLLSGSRKVAMQYSPRCAIPYIANVDAGTVELVRSVGAEVVSSAELIQYFEARWSPEALESHLEAGRRVDRIRREAFAFTGHRIGDSAPVHEFEIKQFILGAFGRSGLITDHGPIVAVNENSSNPHYEPTSEVSNLIRNGDLLLIDMWAKLNQPSSVYYDITWVGVCGSPSDEMQNVFGIVREARNIAIDGIRTASTAGQLLRGFEVDDLTRAYISDQGFGEYFIHRTGHSIGEDVHGTGANMDNLETHDDRRIVPWTCFSIEPGIYLPRFGIRSEVNMFVGEREARVTGEIQDELVRI